MKLKRRNIILIVMLGFALGAQGQFVLSTKKKSAQKAYAEANKKYYNGNINEGIALVDKAIKKDKTFSEAYWFKASMQASLQAYDQQIETLSQAACATYPYYHQTLLKLSSALFDEGKYGLAEEALMKIKNLNLSRVTLNELVEDKLRRCSYAKSLMLSPVPFTPKNLGDEVNTPFEDYWPVISADESRLITTVLVEEKRGMHTHYQEDFYESNKTPTGWGRSTPLSKPLNTTNNEGAQSLSPDGKMLFFSACNRANGSGQCDIFISFYSNGAWSEPFNPGFPLNTSAWEAHPSLSSNGHTLYFCSNRPGSMGKRDIWIAELELKEGGEIVINEVYNAGSTINTVEDEVSPYIHFDDQTLYFSSDGHYGLGRHDIFMARKLETAQWGEPENLGYPINTNRDEIGFVVNALGSKAYFASENIREDRQDKDIFMIPLPQDKKPIPVTYLEGNIFDKEDSIPLKASFELSDLNTGELISNSYSQDDGTFLVCLPIGHDYALNVSKKKYLFYSDRFALTEQANIGEPIVKDIPMVLIKAGSAIELKNIYFEFDAFDLKSSSFLELNKVLVLLNQNPSMVVEIGGHTDGKGSRDYNLVLSAKRADAVKKYLLSKGIMPQRLVSKGYGFAQPLDVENPNNAINRRTELRVLEL